MLVGILQNPQISNENKQRVYQETLPVISMYMEELNSRGVGGIEVVNDLLVNNEEIKQKEEVSITKPSIFLLFKPQRVNLSPKNK